MPQFPKDFAKFNNVCDKDYDDKLSGPDVDNLTKFTTFANGYGSDGCISRNPRTLEELKTEYLSKDLFYESKFWKCIGKAMGVKEQPKVK